MNSNRASFTAADTMPVKLLQNHKLIESITQRRIIPPLHVQLIPTNKCNLKCSFCSCERDDRSGEMDAEEMARLIYNLKKIKTEGITITGGGEPLLYPHIQDLINRMWFHEIKIGLVTNGLLLSKIIPIILNMLTWCRISQGDTRENWSQRFFDRLSGVINNAPDVGWAFSYVVSLNPNIEKIKRFIEFADENNFTHIRLVADLLQPDKVNMDKLREEIKSQTVPVIFQDRNKPEKGENCRVCYLRPVITPDMKVYACCGAQYALKKPTLNFPPELCLGDVSQLPEIIAKSSEPFEGAKHCQYCYYGNYNRTLDMLMTNTQHREFI